MIVLSILMRDASEDTLVCFMRFVFVIEESAENILLMEQPPLIDFICTVNVA